MLHIPVQNIYMKTHTLPTTFEEIFRLFLSFCSEQYTHYHNICDLNDMSKNTPYITAIINPLVRIAVVCGP